MMADVHKFSEQLIDLAERMSGVADAAAGKRSAPQSRSAGVGRWILLPAAGAALYAAGRSQFFARRAKAVLVEARGLTEEAKTRAADLPNDLLDAVRQESRGSASARRSTQTRRRKSSARTARARTDTRRSTSRRASKSG
jgi:hypothetical protein